MAIIQKKYYEYYEQLYAKKMDPEEMDKFLETYSLP